MSSADFLLWVRGPGLNVALLIFFFGMVLRLFEIFMLGRKPTLSKVRSNGVASGLRTIVTRSLPPDIATAKRSLFTTVAGYIFHIGLLIALFLFTPHLELFESSLGFAWPGLPTPIVDFATVMAMLALIGLLWYRVTDKVRSYLSTSQDYLVWALTFLPLLTGYLSYHHMFFPYSWMLAFHILSVELLLVLFPFTKLMHAITLFVARYYNGMMAGQKGVQQ